MLGWFEKLKKFEITKSFFLFVCARKSQKLFQEDCFTPEIAPLKGFFKEKWFLSFQNKNRNKTGNFDNSII